MLDGEDAEPLKVTKETEGQKDSEQEFEEPEEVEEEPKEKEIQPEKEPEEEEVEPKEKEVPFTGWTVLVGMLILVLAKRLW